MSSILKALKKVEQEKTSRIPGLLKIDSDILRTVDSPRRSSSYTSMLLLLVFGGGAAAAFYFMKGPKAPPAPNDSTPVVTIKAVPTPTAAPEVIQEVVPAKAEDVTARKVPTARAVDSANSDKSKKTDIAAKRELPAVTAVPALRVNGIAFQNSAADSMAIVNGTAVSNGSIFEGVTVEEIRKDRVLFQYNGEKFEIQLGQSNRQQ